MAETEFQGRGAEDYRQAEWVAQRLHHEWRYDHTAERWHHFDGKRWAPDQTNAIHYAVAKAASLSLQDKSIGETEQKLRFALMQWAVQDRVLKALATLEGYGTNGDDWDAEPHLLGVKNGVVDLRENKLVPATPEQKVTKSTHVDFQHVEGDIKEVMRDGGAFDKAAPKFMEVMREWMSGDIAMVAFLLLWFGASLFGFTPEQRFLLMVGIGRNGKGSLKHSIVKAVGDYGAQSDANLYMRSKFGAASSDRPRADLIAIKGKRITFFSEPEGMRFNEEMLKAHTGGDRIVARALNSNNVQSWDPTHSITFLVNNAPEIEDLGPSMAARVMVADFRERYDGEKENKLLYGKLEAEAPGILGILCYMAAAWHASWSAGKGGITLPERVVEQSKAFMERNDPVANWLNEQAVYGPGFRAGGGAAYESFKEWYNAQEYPDDVMSNVRFIQTMEKKGIKRYRNASSRGFEGFRLLNVMEQAEKDGDDDDEPV